MWMVGGQAAAPESVQEHGDLQRLGELAQRTLTASPVEPRARHDHRAVGLPQQQRGALDRVRVDVPGVAPPTARRAQRQASLSGAGEKTWSRGKSRKDRPRGAAPSATAIASSTSSWISAGGVGGGGQLHQRPHERDVIDLLQRALPPAPRGRARPPSTSIGELFC